MSSKNDFVPVATFYRALVADANKVVEAGKSFTRSKCLEFFGRVFASPTFTWADEVAAWKAVPIPGPNAPEDVRAAYATAKVCQSHLRAVGKSVKPDVEAIRKNYMAGNYSQSLRSAYDLAIGSRKRGENGGTRKDKGTGKGEAAPAAPTTPAAPMTEAERLAAILMLLSQSSDATIDTVADWCSKAVAARATVKSA